MLLESSQVPTHKHLRTGAEKENSTVLPTQQSFCDGLKCCQHNVISAQLLEFIDARINGESEYDSLQVTRKSSFSTFFEKPKDRFICTSRRTHHRIMSPSLKHLAHRIKLARKTGNTHPSHQEKD